MTLDILLLDSDLKSIKSNQLSLTLHSVPFLWVGPNTKTWLYLAHFEILNKFSEAQSFVFKT